MVYLDILPPRPPREDMEKTVRVISFHTVLCTAPVFPRSILHFIELKTFHWPRGWPPNIFPDKLLIKSVRFYKAGFLLLILLQGSFSWKYEVKIRNMSVNMNIDLFQEYEETNSQELVRLKMN